ncbi:MAG: rhodanese-like domain-containing protein [Candidatus Acidiferrales bacterium]
MLEGRKSRALGYLCAAAGLAALLAAALLCVTAGGTAGTAYPIVFASEPQTEPWSTSQTIQPSDLIKELGESKGANKPVVVCVGFRPLYMGAHVPGAVFHGAAQSEQGLADLKKWAQGVPRSANLVVYCGCCPLEHCPNIRPAFTALHDMGFTRLRVLLLPHDFATDWVEKGYPIEKGTERYSNSSH